MNWRTVGKYPRPTNEKFLHDDFSICKLYEDLKFLATNAYKIKKYTS
jgi:hypothetical protein